MAAKEAPKAEEAAIYEVSCILLDGYTVNHGQIRGGKGEEAKQPNAKAAFNPPSQLSILWQPEVGHRKAKILWGSRWWWWRLPRRGAADQAEAHDATTATTQQGAPNPDAKKDCVLIARTVSEGAHVVCIVCVRYLRHSTSTIWYIQRLGE